MSEDQKITSFIAEPVHITLTKNTKGYSWEISIHGKDLTGALAVIQEAQEHLKASYGSEPV